MSAGRWERRRLIGTSTLTPSSGDVVGAIGLAAGQASRLCPVSGDLPDEPLSGPNRIRFPGGRGSGRASKCGSAGASPWHAAKLGLTAYSLAEGVYRLVAPSAIRDHAREGVGSNG